MYCENCGAKIDDDSKFCENCGALVEQEVFEDDETERDSRQESVRASEEITDLEELMGMDDAREKTAASEPTMVFTKESLRTEYKKTQEDEQGESAASNEQAEKREAGTSEELEIFEGKESESVDEGEVSFGLRPTSQKTKEPLELEIPDILKANGDERLLWEAKAVVRNWEAEDEWQEEDDWQEEPQIETGSMEPSELEQKEEKAIAADDEAAPELPYEQEAYMDGFEDTVSKRADTQWENTEPLEDEPSEKIEEVKRQDPEQSELFEKEVDVEEEPRNEALFCMACGKQLPAGAAFCDACGTPTGEVAPIQIPKKRTEHKIALEILRNIFAKPSEVIEKAASEDVFYVGIGFFVIKDIILAILGAVFMGRLIDSLGIGALWLIGGGEPFGFAAKVFLCGILLDALWIGILYGAGLLFHAECSIRQLTGACGAASLFPAIVLIVAAVLCAFAPAAGLCAVIAAAAVGLIGMVKAASAVLYADENKRFYLLLAASVCYIVIVFAASQALL